MFEKNKNTISLRNVFANDLFVSKPSRLNQTVLPYKKEQQNNAPVSHTATT